MSRFGALLRLDVTVQLRTRLYAIGVAAGVFVACAVAALSGPEHLVFVAPTVMLLAVGGTTMAYVAALVLYENDERTLDAILVSPLRPVDYLASKLTTLTGLAALESVVMIGGAMLIMSFSAPVTIPNVPLLLIGVVAIGVMYTLIGILLVVRYDRITDFLLPLGAAASVLQLPFLYFLNLVPSRAFLVIPTAAPTVLMQGAYRPLEGWEWAYAIGYTTVANVGLAIWAHRAFVHHVVRRIRSS